MCDLQQHMVENAGHRSFLRGLLSACSRKPSSSTRSSIQLLLLRPEGQRPGLESRIWSRERIIFAFPPLRFCPRTSVCVRVCVCAREGRFTPSSLGLLYKGFVVHRHANADERTRFGLPTVTWRGCTCIRWTHEGGAGGWGESNRWSRHHCSKKKK